MKNGEHCRQFINYINHLTSDGAPAEIFDRRETILKTPNILMHRLNEMGLFERRGARLFSGCFNGGEICV